MRAIQDGVAPPHLGADAFALAESWDEEVVRYRGQRAARNVEVSPESAELLVKPEVARRQLDAETPAPPPTPGDPEDPQPDPEPTHPELYRLQHRRRRSGAITAPRPWTTRGWDATPAASPRRWWLTWPGWWVRR